MSIALEIDDKVDVEIPFEPLPYRYEVIDGQIVEMPPMSDLANIVANRLHLIMGHHSHRENQGESLMEALIKLPAPMTTGLTFASFLMSDGPKTSPSMIVRMGEKSCRTSLSR